MKKLLHKLRRKKEIIPPSARITSETVADHRERILAGGRRFKYPIQYARHKLVFNAIAISIVALIVVIVIGWWQLYKVQNTSEFMYRVTKVIPVSVANIDGQPVLYSDYLMKYISSAHYLEQKEQINFKTDNGKKQLEYIKQQSMQDAIADAYAVKMAHKLNISVTDSELGVFLKEQRQSSDGEISEKTYNAVILDYYGWSPSEYRYVTKIKLLRQKVAYTMDKNALNAIGSVVSVLKDSPASNLQGLVTNIFERYGVKAVYGTSGWVPKTNQDGGLTVEATKLQKLQTSQVIKSTTGSGYYVIKLLDVNDTKVTYEYIQVPLSVFTKALDDTIAQHKVKKYISVSEK